MRAKVALALPGSIPGASIADRRYPGSGAIERSVTSRITVLDSRSPTGLHRSRQKTGFMEGIRTGQGAAWKAAGRQRCRLAGSNPVPSFGARSEMGSRHDGIVQFRVRIPASPLKPLRLVGHDLRRRREPHGATLGKNHMRMVSELVRTPFRMRLVGSDVGLGVRLPHHPLGESR